MNKKYYIIGLPDSGKTSFIGALGYYLISNAANDSALSLDSINNMDYISQVAEQWAMCEKAIRTNETAFYNISLNLQNKETDSKINVTLPDQSGETFRHIINRKAIDEEMYKQLSECGEILIFINPSRIKRDALIPDIPEEIRTETDAKVNMTSEPHLNIQAEYVQMLQYLYYIRKNSINLKIIVSAWDMYSEYELPEKVLKDRVPLVWQYLHTNEEYFHCEYWGISSQGGDLNIEEEKQKLLEYENNIERIIVVNQRGEKSNDITSILA